jgi:proteasome lid subunit RPN8/RPN11
MAVIDEQISAPAPASRDAARLRAEDYPQRDLPALTARRESRYQVVIRQSVMNDLHAHGKENTEVEICGVLLGNVYHDSRGTWCLIDASVRGNFASHKQTQVTITSETWTHVNQERDRLYPDKKFIGWYHTHPGFGIFLSGMDDFIQGNWFAEPWQIALVYDPKSGEEGVFVWRDGKTVAEPFIVVSEDGAAGSSAGSQADDSPTAMKVPSGTLGDLMSRLQAVEQRQRWIFAALGAIGLIALIWPLMVMLFVGGLGTKTPSNQADPAPHNSGGLPTAVRPPSNQGL